MPKTRDAFALREIYNERGGVAGFGDLIGLPELTGDISKNISKIESKPREMVAALKRTEILERLIARHRMRLQKYLMGIFDRLAGNDGDEKANQNVRRALTLMKKYGALIDILVAHRKELDFAIQRSGAAMILSFRREFGARLRQARKVKHLTVASVAKKLGMSRAGYSFYESGDREPPLWTLFQLSEMFGVSTDWLIGRE